MMTPEDMDELMKKPLRAPEDEHLKEPLYHTEWKIANQEWQLKTVEACVDLTEEDEDQ